MNKRTRQFGVTLVELIIVIAIIAIMAAAVYVVRKPAEDKGKIELTQSTIELLCGALEQYHNFYNEFPDPNEMDSEYYPGDCGTAGFEKITEKLYYRLSLCPDAQAVLNQINSKMKENTDNDNYLEYVDAWGNEFKYEYDTTNFVNFPLITSKGPDGNFATKEDNITSRK